MLAYALPSTIACLECENVLHGEALNSSPLGRVFTVLMRGHKPNCSHYNKTYKLPLQIMRLEEA